MRKHEDQPKEFSEILSSPKITIITAVYNAEKYLDSCISSILNQTYKNFEYIIIDGGSTDSTLSIIKKYQNQLTHWVSEPDKGIYDAWNKGLAKASGDWIAFVGADDQLYPDALYSYVQHIVHHPNQNMLDFVSSRIELVNMDLSLIEVVGETWEWERFRHQMITWHVGTFHSKQLFIKYGFFDTEYKISGDYELLLRAKNQLVTSFIDKITAKMRVGGVSSVNLFKASSETYRAKIKNDAISLVKGNLLMVFDKLRLFIRIYI
ncbi:glycosyltransferase family 2 protein [Spirosoma foliorum]|uniref:Glycosyltransferase n=1 Tax=Spirosoma foliorum TaxID=2710596 RepID=A0A7G5GSK6_9BACT|nr:glycosyltransferase family 2 protein [Spirosoma foliorum]QMW01848.1 glycosyltransferase [Spirosoma foliorum]